MGSSSLRRLAHRRDDPARRRPGAAVAADPSARSSRDRLRHGRDRLRKGRVTCAQAMDAVESVWGGRGHRQSLSRLPLQSRDVAADNASSGAFVTGPIGLSPADLDPRRRPGGVGGRSRLGHRRRGPGHPGEALALAANDLARRGHVIEAGWIVLTGGMTDAVFAPPGASSASTSPILAPSISTAEEPWSRDAVHRRHARRGRSPEQLRTLITKLTDAAVEAVGAPPGRFAWLSGRSLRPTGRRETSPSPSDVRRLPGDLTMVAEGESARPAGRSARETGLPVAAGEQTVEGMSDLSSSGTSSTASRSSRSTGTLRRVEPLDSCGVGAGRRASRRRYAGRGQFARRVRRGRLAAAGRGERAKAIHRLADLMEKHRRPRPARLDQHGQSRSSRRNTTSAGRCGTSGSSPTTSATTSARCIRWTPATTPIRVRSRRCRRGDLAVELPADDGVVEDRPAIAWGNTCIIKPAEDTPTSVTHLGGWPPRPASRPAYSTSSTGTVRRPGRPDRDDRVDRVTFTGESVTGKTVMASAATHLAPVSLELGGRGRTSSSTTPTSTTRSTLGVEAIFRNAGQVCLAGSRLFVQATVYDEFLGALPTAAEAMTIRRPDDPKTRFSSWRAGGTSTRSPYVDTAEELGGKG